MDKWRTILQGTALVMTLAAGTMLAQETSTDFDHNANFAQYHTFCFNKVYASDPTVQGKLKDAIAKDLTAKGWQQSDSGCNISVAAVGDVKGQKEYQTFYDSLGPEWAWSAGLSGWGTWGNESSITSVDNIPVGLLIVDLYDANSKQLVWRGTSRDYLSGNEDKNAEKLSKSVNKMFNKFPPKSK
jgi:hypothetical protein